MELMMTKVLSKFNIAKFTFETLHVERLSIYFFLLSRTPGSRQPSPAEEHLARNSFGLEQGINVGGFSQPMMQHMLNNHDQQQMGSSSFHPQHMSHHILNGGMVQVS